MKRFRNILILYARRIGDEAALERATALARSNGARLTVVETLDADSAQQMVTEREAHLSRLAASIRADGVDVHTRVLRGRDFLAIVRAVQNDGYDLVIMTADSVQGIRTLTFGTTSMHLMRKCPCPVWVMNPQAGGHFSRASELSVSIPMGHPALSTSRLRRWPARSRAPSKGESTLSMHGTLSGLTLT